MQLDLSPDELAALVRYLRIKLNAEELWFSPALRPIKTILLKLDPSLPPGAWEAEHRAR